MKLKSVALDISSYRQFWSNTNRNVNKSIELTILINTRHLTPEEILLHINKSLDFS
jgi:hypothetical protein